MRGIFYKKFNMNEIFETNLNKPIVVLAETDPETRAIYARYLSRANFIVNLCAEVDALHKQMLVYEPDILVCNPNFLFGFSSSVFHNIRSLYPKLPIVTVGDSVVDTDMDKLMKLGVSAHLSRKFSQPNDLVFTVEQLLYSN